MRIPSTIETRSYSPCVNGTAPGVVFSANQRTFGVSANPNNTALDLAPDVYAGVVLSCVPTSYLFSLNCGVTLPTGGFTSCDKLYDPSCEGASAYPVLLTRATDCNGNVIDLTIDWINPNETDPIIACIGSSVGAAMQVAINAAGNCTGSGETVSTIGPGAGNSTQAGIAAQASLLAVLWYGTKNLTSYINSYA